MTPSNLIKHRVLSTSVLLTALSSNPVMADLPAHGQNSFDVPQPLFTIGVQSSTAAKSSQRAVELGIRLKPSLGIVFDLIGGDVESADLAQNAAVELEHKGGGISAYYQLPSYWNASWATALRYHTDRSNELSILSSGGRRVEFLDEKITYELSLLAHPQKLTLWKGIRPYAVVGARTAKRDQKLTATGGRLVRRERSVPTSSYFAAGMHWSMEPFSLFAEFEASTDVETRWRAHVGAKLGIL